MDEDERGGSLSWQSPDNQKQQPATPSPPCSVAAFPCRSDRLPVLRSSFLGDTPLRIS